MKSVGTNTYFSSLYEDAYNGFDRDFVLDILNRVVALNPGDRYRLAGSKWEWKTAEFLGNLFNEMGYRVEFQKVEVDGWRYVDGYLEVDGYQGKIPVYTYAGLTGGEAEGQLIYIGKGAGEDFNKIQPGSVVLINLDFNVYETHVMPALEAFSRGASAVLFTHLSDTGLEFYIDNSYFIYDGEPWIDGLIGVIRPYDGEILLDYIGRKTFVKIDSSREKGVGYNVIAYKEGEKNLDVLVTAHHDGYDPGVMDNLSGVAYIASLAKLFKDLESRYNLYFISFTAEEFGDASTSYDYLIGSDRYFEKIDPNRVVFMLNVDIIGLRGLPIGIFMTSDLSSYVNNVINSLSNMVRHGVKSLSMPSLWLDMWPAVRRGVSSISLSHIGDNYYFRRYYHTENDDIQLLDLDVFREGLSLGYVILNYIMDSYPHYNLSHILEDINRYMDIRTVKVLGYDRYHKYHETIRKLRNIEYMLELLGRERYISRVLLMMNRIRSEIFRKVYRLGKAYPTEKLASYFPEYYMEILNGLEDILFYLERGEDEKAIRMLENLNINRWARHLSIDTVITLLDEFRRGSNWGGGATYPYFNLRELLEIRNASKLAEHVKRYYGLAYEKYMEEMSNLVNYVIDLDAMLDGLEEFIRENIKS